MWGEWQGFFGQRANVCEIVTVTTDEQSFPPYSCSSKSSSNWAY